MVGVAVVEIAPNGSKFTTAYPLASKLANSILGGHVHVLLVLLDKSNRCVKGSDGGDAGESLAQVAEEGGHLDAVDSLDLPGLDFKNGVIVSFSKMNANPYLDSFIKIF